MNTNSPLVQLRHHHQLILDSAGEGIYGLDGDGRITFSNTAATQILGWRHEDVAGKRAHEVHHHSHADGSTYPRDDCPIYAALVDGEVHHVVEEGFWNASGEAVPVEYTSTPILKNGEKAARAGTRSGVRAGQLLEEFDRAGARLSARRD